MDRRRCLWIAGLVLASTPLSATATPQPRLDRVNLLDVEVTDVGSGGSARLNALLSRRCVLLAIDADSAAGAAWLERELLHLPAEQLDELLVLLVSVGQDGASRPLLIDPARHPGLRLYRTTAAQWQRPGVGAVLPQLLAVDDDGRIAMRLLGAGPRQPGLAHAFGSLQRAGMRR